MRQHERPELTDGFDIILKFPNDWAQLIHHDIPLVMDSEGKEDFLEALLTSTTKNWKTGLSFKVI